MWLLVALVPAYHHLDGNLDPAPAPERQSDAAQATNPTFFPCLLYCNVKIKNFNTLMRLRQEK
jgi:hypothetical protein